MIIAIPTDDKLTVSKVFGRAQYFAIYRKSEDQAEFVEGTSHAEHGAGTGAVSKLAELGVEKIYAPEIGPKAQEALALTNIIVKKAPAGISLEQALKFE